MRLDGLYRCTKFRLPMPKWAEGQPFYATEPDVCAKFHDSSWSFRPPKMHSFRKRERVRPKKINGLGVPQTSLPNLVEI